MTRGLRLAAVIAFIALVTATPAAAADGGSGTYTVSGASYDFTLVNPGTTRWQYFSLVAPAGAQFLGGANSAENSAQCVVGPPEKIVCGPLSANLAPPGASFAFVATLASPVACGQPFAFYVSSTDTSSFTRGNDLMLEGDCTPTLRADAPPVIHGLPRVGRTLTAAPPLWSTTPALVTYRWQLCAKSRCAAIAGASTLHLKLTKPDRGHTVRIVATATLNGTRITTRSSGLAVT